MCAQDGRSHDHSGSGGVSERRLSQIESHMGGLRYNRDYRRNKGSEAKKQVTDPTVLVGATRGRKLQRVTWE